MNILYIEHYAGSPDMGMEFRPYYLSREWVRMGHKVSIIAADYSHLRIKNPKITKDFQKETVDGIDYYWIHTSTYKRNGINRAKTMAQFIGKLYVKAKWIADRFKPDVIITSSTYPLDTYVGQRIKKHRPFAKLIHEIHDMWPAVLTEVNGMSRWNPFVITMQIAEKSFCKHSDYVVSLPPCSKEYLINHGMQPEKFLDVANGVNSDEWENAEELNYETLAIFQRLKEENKFIICFFGSLTNYYALPELIEAVQEIDNPNITVVFVGDGVYKKELEEIANRKNKNRILFLGKIPKRQVPSMLKEVDALYIGGAEKTVFKYGICMNKLFDSMMSGKPILYAVDAPNNYIVDYDCGISVTPGSVKALCNGISKMVSMPEKDRNSLGENGHVAVLKHFTYPVLADKFASIFNN